MAEIEIRDLAIALTDGSRRFEVKIPAFRLGAGERIAILGETGSGKTTALDVLALASPPTAADRFVLRADGTSIDLAAAGGRRDFARLRARHFGYVLQTSPHFPFLTLTENAALAQRLSGRVEPRRVARLLRETGIDFPARTPVTALSIGQRQRLAVVRALAHAPDFLLCDEPTGALDPATADRLMTVMLAAAGERAGVLVVSHDAALVRRHGFAIWRMERESGSTSVLRPESESGREVQP